MPTPSDGGIEYACEYPRGARKPRHGQRVVKVFGMVNCEPGFGEQPKVIDGFSDLMVEVFGEAGKHARSAVGMAALPNNIPVEVEMIVEVRR